MLKRLVFIAMLALAAVRADALEYTDVYYNPNESGWGFFLVQGDTAQFLASFIYDRNGQPTCYTGWLTQDAAGNYNGTLYALTATFFANPWQGITSGPNAVGTISFVPTDSYHANVTYTVNGVGSASKTVQRQTMTPYVLSGNCSGSMSGSIGGCADPHSNDTAFRARYGLMVTEVADSSATLTFSFVDQLHNGIVCTSAGPLTHFGRLYRLNAQQSCSGPGQDGAAYAVTIDSLHPTGQGIEGHLTASVGGGCMASLHFAAVRNVNN